MGLFLSELTLAISQRTFGLYSETCLIRHCAEPNNYVGFDGVSEYSGVSITRTNFVLSSVNLTTHLYFLSQKGSFTTRGKHNIDTQIETKYLFSSPLPPVECRRAHVLYTLFVFACAQWCPTHIVLCFCFVFSSCYGPYVVRVSGVSILVFSNVYLIKNIIRSIIIIVIVLYQLL